MGRLQPRPSPDRGGECRFKLGNSRAWVGAFEDAEGKKIKPTTIRPKDRTSSYKGYRRAAFEDVFDRYLPALPPSPSVTSVTDSKSAATGGLPAVTTPVTEAFPRVTAPPEMG